MLCDGLQLLVRNIQNFLYKFLFLLEGPGHLLVFPPELLDGSDDWLGKEDLVARVDRHLSGGNQFPDKNNKDDDREFAVRYL